MRQIVFIGVGDVAPLRRVVSDMLLTPALRGELRIVLHDPDPDLLATAEALFRALDAEAGSAADIVACGARRTALEGADFVVTHFTIGGFDATLRDFEIPHQYGLQQTIGETIGIGGIFRGLRTIPTFVELGEEMAEVCPQAWLLSDCDPIAMLGLAVQKATAFQRFAGVCHSVCDTHAYLASLVGGNLDEIDFLTAGFNHQAFVLRFESDGRSLYPELDVALSGDPDLSQHARTEMYRRFGYFPTQSSEHAAEYVPWFLRRPDETRRLGVRTEQYLRWAGQIMHRYEEARRALSAGRSLLLRWQHQEPATAAMLAVLLGEPAEVYVNVANKGLISNLPDDCCVEVPAQVDADGIHPQPVGDLPIQLAALNRSFLNVVELTVRAVLDGERQHVYHAAMLDPNTAATLPMPAIEALCDELLAAHGDLIPKAIR